MSSRMCRMVAVTIAIAAVAVVSPGCNETESYQELRAEIDQLRDRVESLEGRLSDGHPADAGGAAEDRQTATEPPRLTDLPDPRPQLADSLFDAVMVDNQDRAIDLVRQGAPPNATNANGVPVLFIAAGGCLECEGALVELTRVLLEHGADATATIARGLQAIHWVGRAGAGDRPGTHETLDLLIEYGADINARTDDGIRAIDFATQIGNEEWVEFLISRGAQR